MASSKPYWVHYFPVIVSDSSIVFKLEYIFRDPLILNLSINEKLLINAIDDVTTKCKATLFKCDANHFTFYKCLVH